MAASRRLRPTSFPRRVVRVAAAGLLALAAAGCGEEPAPVAAVSAGLDRPSVPLGGPIELSLQFAVSPTLEPLGEDYRVFVHFLDEEGDLMWAADHDPPVPTSAWGPGQVVSYTRRVQVPMYPYLGEATVGIGLYLPTSGERLALAGQDLGQRVYRGAVLNLEAQAESSFLLYENGWHDSEYDPHSGAQWRWTSERASFAFRNPRADAVLYLQLGGAPDRFPDGRQRVTLRAGDELLREIVLESSEPRFEELALRAEQLGAEQTTRIDLQVSPTFVPAEAPGSASSDGRRLGVRVSYAFLEVRRAPDL